MTKHVTKVATLVRYVTAECGVCAFRRRQAKSKITSRKREEQHDPAKTHDLKNAEYYDRTYHKVKEDMRSRLQAAILPVYPPKHFSCVFLISPSNYLV